MDERKESRRTRERKIISSRRSGSEDFLEQRARAVAQAGGGGAGGWRKAFPFSDEYFTLFTKYECVCVCVTHFRFFGS